MTDITNITVEFQASSALATAEGWQCKGGTVLLSTDASGPQNRGVRLADGQGWPFPAGVTVYYRSIAGSPVIAREPIV
jgi:hypothetical protein